LLFSRCILLERGVVLVKSKLIVSTATKHYIILSLDSNNRQKAMELEFSQKQIKVKVKPTKHKKLAT